MTISAADLGAKNVLQGNYGEALVCAVASAAGLACSRPEIDFGFDRNVEAPDGELMRFQIKTSSVGLPVVDNGLRYPLEIEAYNRLRAEHTVPSYLLVVEVPSEQRDWTGRMASGWALRTRAFYASLRGATASANTTSVTVSLPLGNMVTPESLLRLVRGGA